MRRSACRGRTPPGLWRVVTAPPVRAPTGPPSGRGSFAPGAAALGFCDFSGFDVFLQAWQETHERGIELRLVNPSFPLQRVLQITGAAGLFSLYDGLAQALA